MHGKQLFVATGLDNAFPCIMYHDGTLLCLFVGVAADVYKSLDDIVKGVIVIIVNYQFATAVVEQFNILLLLFFVFFQSYC